MKNSTPDYMLPRFFFSPRACEGNFESSGGMAAAATNNEDYYIDRELHYVDASNG